MLFNMNFDKSKLNFHGGEFEKGLFDYLEANNATELKSIIDEGKISSAVEAKLDEAITAFKGGFTL